MSSGVWLRRYCDLFGVASPRELRDTVVSWLLSAVAEAGGGHAPPIRLADAVHRFGISPHVESIVRDNAVRVVPWQPTLPFVEHMSCGFIRGRHDGEIYYNERLRQFVIRLRDSHGPGDKVRLRFTFAHEVAHRFFFVPSGDGWVRAVMRVSQDLPERYRMQAKWYLTRAEEELCNAIARRVLVPDHLLEPFCPVHRWVAEGEVFAARLMDAAWAFRVSPRTLLVRLKDVSRRAQKSSHFAVMIRVRNGTPGPSHWPDARVITGFGPDFIHGVKLSWYPGLDVCTVWFRSAQAVLSELANGRYGGYASVPFAQSRDRIIVWTGWWRRLAADPRDGSAVVLMWGSLSAAGGTRA
jgi:hypothetical protein